MKEYVGKVLLDYTYYPGEDLYSDGAVEDELLEIAESFGEGELNREIAKRKSWPVLYHFSHLRENIVSWLPIAKTDKVLEIGAGCGAVTGALARRAGSVTCIDLSKKRSLVNAHRHQELENVQILVGNFQDIEPNLEKTYDYITLIGVFEYAEGYIGGDTPYEDFLKKISAHLNPGGKLIVAIENRMGLKYWAGCTEDHNGLLFEGLEGYPTTSGARTFTKKELEETFARSGEYDCQFYYPYPDYKFPMSIHSDSWQPAVGELRVVDYNFDRARLRLFDETRVYDTLIANDLYPLYANSFLVIATPKAGEQQADCGEKERVLYVKYSNERDKRFAIRTEVREGPDGTRLVKKFPQGKAGEGHLNHINISYQLLKGLYRETSIEMNRCKKGDGFITLEYITGRTLEEMLDELLEDGQLEKLWQTLNSYLSVLRKSGSFKLFKPTEKFEKVFGQVKLPDGLVCAEVSNVDCVCSNLLWDERKGKWQMLDYEWTFAFPIPVNFLVYRVLHYYLYTSTARSCLLEEDYFAMAGISLEEREAYARMEESFQKYITGQLTPMRQMYESISPGTLIDLKNSAWEKQCFPDCLQVFVDKGEGFGEENSWLLPCQDGRFKGVIELPEDTVALRLDPTDKCCVVKLSCLGLSEKEEEGLPEEIFQGGDFLPFSTNGWACDEDEYLFDTDDPQIILEKLPRGARRIRLAYEITVCKPKVAALLREQLKENRRSEERLLECRRELEQKKDLIQAMENTKVWKAYRAFKGDKWK